MFSAINSILGKRPFQVQSAATLPPPEADQKIRQIFLPKKSILRLDSATKTTHTFSHVQTSDHWAEAYKASLTICVHNVLSGKSFDTPSTFIYTGPIQPASPLQQQEGELAIARHQEELGENILPFTHWMQTKGLRATKVSGSGLNCLINALLQHATGQYLTEKFAAAETIRNQLQEEFLNLPAMLHDDEPSTARLIQIINEKYQTRLQVIFIQADQTGLPAISSLVPAHVNEEVNPVVIWNQGMHYVGVTTSEHIQALKGQSVGLMQLSSPDEKSPHSPPEDPPKDLSDFHSQNLTDELLIRQVLPLIREAKVERLDLSYNQITALGLKFLRKLPHLKILDISHNPIGDEGAKVLAEAPYLKKVKVFYCGITQSGAEALLKTKVLEDVLWSGNRIAEAREWDKRLGLTLERNKGATDPQYASERKKRLCQDFLEEGIKTAILNEDLEELTLLIPRLENGVHTYLECLECDALSQTDSGAPLLIYAIDQNKVKTAEHLLKLGAKIEDHAREYTPLFNAAAKGQLEMLELLLRHGANISGEFHFNHETALTIAATKFCADCVEYFKFIKECSEKEGITITRFDLLIEEWDEIGENDELPHIAFSYKYYSWDVAGFFLNCYRDLQTLFQEDPELLVTRFKGIEAFEEESTKVYAFNDPEIEDIVTERCIPLSKRAKIYELLRNKVALLKETAPSADNLDETATELGDDQNLVYQLDVLPPFPLKPQVRSEKELRQRIADLNAELKTKTEEQIEWSKYPHFLIAQYRGIHFYRHFFNKAQRKDYRQVTHLNRVAPAPAVYNMAGHYPLHHQVARESVLKKHKKTIVQTFEEFRNSGKTKAYWDRKQSFSNAEDMIQQRMSNSYQSFNQDVEKAKHPVPKILNQKKIKGYPHNPTSDLPIHALKYAYGQKRIDGFTEWRLRPMYQPSGKPLHPYPGKLFMYLFTPLQFYLNNGIHVAGRHNRNNFNLRRDVIWERETGCTGGIEAEIPFREETMEIPSFEQYDASYQEKYGITKQQFTRLKKKIALSLNHPNAEQRDKLRKSVKNTIIEAVIQHQAKTFLKIALLEARRQGGYLIFRHENGEYGLKPEGLRTPTHGDNFYPDNEKLLLEFFRSEYAKVWKSSTNHIN